METTAGSVGAVKIARIGRRSGFIGDASISLAGSLLSNLITIASYPIVTRLYEPSAYGEYAILLVMLTFLSIFGTLRFEWALPGASSDESTALLSLIRSTSAAVAATAVLATIALWVTGSSALALVRYWWFLPSAVLVQSSNVAAQYWLTREGLIATRAISRASHPISNTALRILLGLWRGGSSTGLLAADLAGRCLSQGAVLRSLEYRRALFRSFRVRASRQLTEAKAHKKFAQYSAPNSAVGVGAELAIAAALSLAMSAATYGIYALADRLVRSPVTLLTTALGDAYFRRIAQTDDRHDIEAFSTRVLALVTKGAAPLFGLAATCAPPVIRSLLGEEWIEVGPAASLMLVGAYFYVSVAWMDRLLVVIERHDVALRLEGTFKTIQAAATVAAAYATGELLAAVATHTLLRAIYNQYWVRRTYSLAFSSTAPLNAIERLRGLYGLPWLVLIPAQLWLPMLAVIPAALAISATQLGIVGRTEYRGMRKQMRK